MSRQNLYAQNRHVVIVDSVPWSGFADGDYLDFELHGNAATRTEGGDGPSMNLSSAQGATVTIGLMPNSPSIGLAYEAWKAQASSPRMINIQLVTGTEEVITFSGCMFAKLPAAKSGGPVQSARQFSFECLKVIPDISATDSIDGGLLGSLVGTIL